HDLHIGPVILEPDMFKHPDRNDMVERFINVPVILQSDLNRQPYAQFLAELHLFSGYGNTYCSCPIFLCRIFYEAAPPASNIEHPVAGLQVELPADKVEFCFLGLIKRFSVFPVSTTVDHPLIKHISEQLVPNIIMFFADLKGPRFAAEIDDNSPDYGEEHLPVL